MPLNQLRPNIIQKRKRVGRGSGSGHGNYSGKGRKGQTARTGGRVRPGFEGGQTPYLRKMPKIKHDLNPNQIRYEIVNVGSLNIFENNAEVNRETLLAKNLISKTYDLVKLLGGKGKLEKKLKIKVDKASEEAIKIAREAGCELTFNDKSRKAEKKDKRNASRLEQKAEPAKELTQESTPEAPKKEEKKPKKATKKIEK